MSTHNIMFSSRNKKNIYLIPPLIKTYAVYAFLQSDGTWPVSSGLVGPGQY